MDGSRPDTGKQLVEPKKATSPLPQLVGEPLLAALQQAAAEHGGTVEELVAGVKSAVAGWSAGWTLRPSGHRGVLIPLRHEPKVLITSVRDRSF
ncbi:hypothetical protein ACIBI9_65930 [Nonomuraea sp. NPDC050451]|uniref:hypothetical protein n=1 Tax=Nonomuraea sp. NPDC050451 TaxID=3364364 RepID=UPI0037BBC5B7